ncbi:unannotated protein [freshwater metagenome]|uniref:GDP-mannose 4,6-dehydratase n=1 Tax=freshwater metagenome TaxID=449393 RepID=A0A6J7CES8_9ZZZZ|nr:GDP-mannose 4,6-dehydratase [Actinomycetota bacterium]MSW25677.1 GDP-mannose 4,6-dehydratase [Actinomycetota bacterium]MSW33409.1 GDP-mannose 4,6-dehydratase [Actinomycetota bacterium]MSX30433.1 GDP-mannose 4,6-dehydratase [Actinomycetota bacterium]MSX51335.1 GDP-mannose 4,6-dehydratase [Actinomycetota bacterium]
MGVKKRALITGITGQDGSYLSEFLLKKNYEVHGVVRPSSTLNTSRIDHLLKYPRKSHENVQLHFCDLSDHSRLLALLIETRPDEIYNLAAQSHVGISFDQPILTGEITGIATAALLDSVFRLKLDSKFYQASTSELFGNTPPPQNEDSILEPRSPYAIAKLYSYFMTRNYREAYGLFAANGILFNHESPRRSERFVTRKITSTAARIAKGSIEKLYLGNLSAIRDWGYAPEYVEGMWKMMQHDRPDDFILATGVGTTVREFCERTFSLIGKNYEDFVVIDENQLRPTEVENLLGNFRKAEKSLGWKPDTDVNSLIEIMLKSDIAALNH